MQLKRKIYLVLIAWIAFIWLHSTIAGPSSQHESDQVVLQLGNLWAFLGITNSHLMSFIVRKTAHFIEYFILGLLIKATKRSYENVNLLYGLIVLVPVIDECIQFFTPGRSCQLSDMILDAVAATIGCLVFKLVQMSYSRIRSK